MKRLLTLAALAAATVAQAQDSPVPRFSPEDFHAHVAFLADDVLEGRQTGSHGNLISLILHALEPDVDFAFHMAMPMPAIYRLTHDGLRWRVMGGHGFSPADQA